MKRTKFMKTNILFGILLLTLCLFTGSCSNDDKAVIEPAPEFELVTEISETEPLFIVPDQTFKLEYTAKNHQVYRYQYAARRMDCGGKGKRKQHQYKSYF